MGVDQVPARRSSIKSSSGGSGDAQVAETTYTAFTSAAKTHQVTARLIVRRVKRLHPKAGPQGQGELFTVYRFHAVFTDSTASTLTAEAQHRGPRHRRAGHRRFERLGPETFPSGRMNANGAWLACAVMAYNLTRAVGVLAGGALGRARTATIGYQIINVPARISFSAREFSLHLPAHSRRERRLNQLVVRL